MCITLSLKLRNLLCSFIEPVLVLDSPIGKTSGRELKVRARVCESSWLPLARGICHTLVEDRGFGARAFHGKGGGGLSTSTAMTQRESKTAVAEKPRRPPFLTAVKLWTGPGNPLHTRTERGP